MTERQRRGPGPDIPQSAAAPPCVRERRDAAAATAPESPGREKRQVGDDFFRYFPVSVTILLERFDAAAAVWSFEERQVVRYNAGDDDLDK